MSEIPLPAVLKVDDHQLFADVFGNMQVIVNGFTMGGVAWKEVEWFVGFQHSAVPAKIYVKYHDFYIWVVINDEQIVEAEKFFGQFECKRLRSVH